MEADWKNKIKKLHDQREKVLILIEKADMKTIEEYIPRLNQMFYDSDIGFLKRVEKEPVRALKNIMLSCNTLYFVSSERGGLDPIRAHYMAEKYAILIETVNTKTDLLQIHTQMILDYSNPEYRTTKDKCLSEKVKQFVNNNFMDSDMDIEMISKAISFSKEHLMRNFKKEQQITINEFIQKVRITEAETLLKYSDFDINEIAYMVGFNSSQYFSHVFKNKNGITAKEYRKINKI